MMHPPITILVVESNLRRAEFLLASLSRPGTGDFNLLRADSLPQAEKLARGLSVDVIVTRAFLPDASGLEPLVRYREFKPEAVVLALLEDDEKGGALDEVQALADECIFYKDLTVDYLAESVRFSLDRREMLRELRARQASAPAGTTPFRALLNYLDEAVFVVSSPEGELLFANEVADAWFPGPKEETLRELFEYGPLGCEALELEIATGNALVPNAELRSVELEWRERKCSLITLRNISKRKRAEEAYKGSQRRLELALKASNVGLWSWDLRTHQLQFSERWKQQLGYGSHGYPSTLSAFRNAMHPEDRSRIGSEFREALRNGVGDFELEYRMRHRDGSYRDILCRAEVFPDAEGRLASLLGTHIDVSERKARERSQLEASVSRAEEVAARLASRLEETALLIGRKTREMRAHFRSDSRVAAELLELEKLSERTFQLNVSLRQPPLRQPLATLSPLDLGSQVEQLVPRLQCLLPDKVAVELDLQKGVEILGWSGALFRMAMSEALLSLGERISTEFKSRLLIRVEERVAEARKAQACLEFVYAGDEVEREGLEALLALPQLAVSTCETEGLAMLKLNFDSPAPSERGSAAFSKERKGEKSLALLAEDEEVLRLAIQTMLESLGFEVVVAQNGAAALDAFFQRPEAFEIALVDLHMPEIDGESVVASLRSASSSLAIIKMSGDGEGWSPAPFEEVDEAARVLGKPFGVQELTRAIADLRRGVEARC